IRKSSPVHSIVHYHRKPRLTGNYSLEAIFHDVRQRLPEWPIKQVVAPCLSNGLWRRVQIILHAWWHQGDVTHVTGDINFATLLLRKRTTVLTILDCIDADRPGCSGWIYRKLWFGWPARRAALITTISEASKLDIVKYTGCDPQNIVVTGVAISQSYQFYPKEFDSKRPVILQIGTAPNKNIERLAEALQRINCKLVIVGVLNDSQRAALACFRIIFEEHQRLSKAQLLEKYIESDMVSFVSTFEGFGMPILEGNAVGRPVITGNCTSMPEVAGDAACLVDPYSVASIRAGIQQIIEDPVYRDILITRGLKNAKRFDPDVIAQKYLGVYQRLTKVKLP
ncbi:MAG: glycosyltransferase family 4 protein, partial [Planctomycetales bacterium]|nr:glycosyltransferase family 4 protein [Planctomycetales bacterium]